MVADLVMADLGLAKKCDKGGEPVLPLRHIPADMLPLQLLLPHQPSGESAAQETGGKKMLQPDAMIAQTVRMEQSRSTRIHH